MGRQQTIVGLDVGTTKTCAVIGKEHRDAQLRVLGMGTAPSYGLKGGQIVDMVLTIKAIDEAVYRAEKSAKTRINGVVAGVAGGHLKSQSQHAELRLTGQQHEVDDHHINAVVRTAATLSLPAERELVAIIPKTFSVDHLTNVMDPRGLTGRRLAVDAHVVTGATNAVANLETCASRAGVTLVGKVLQPLASADACLTHDQRREGVALVDIGGGTTDVAVFVDDACWHIAVIPMGGALVTADIARGLRLPSRVAEAVKIEHGRVDPWAASDKSTVEAPGFDFGAPVAIRRRDLAEVITARMEEILAHVKDALARSGYYDILAAGVVLTGGGSRVPGLTGLASDTLDLPATIGRPLALWGLDDEMRAPEFSTGIGLMLAGAHPESGQGWLEPKQARHGGVLTRLGGWMRSVVRPPAA